MRWNEIQNLPKARGVEEAAWSDLRKENDNLSPSGMKRRMKKERKKFVIWQHFGNNHDVPFTTTFSDYIFAKLGADLNLTTATHNHVKCETYFNIFFLFSSSLCAHFSLGYKIPSIFLRPIKRWKKSAKQNEWHDAMRDGAEWNKFCFACFF